MNLDPFNNPLEFLLNSKHNDHSIKCTKTLKFGEIRYESLGFYYFTPKEKTQNKIVLSCGIHGNETAPIEIINDILKDIISNRQKVKSEVLFIFGNIEAMKKQVRFCDYNLNRLFSNPNKNKDSSLKELFETSRAYILEEKMIHFFQGKNELSPIRWHFDLHTAIRESYVNRFAVIPFQENLKLNSLTFQILESLDIDAALIYHNKNTTFSHFSSEHLDCHSFTLELGKVRPFGENNRSDFLNFETGLRYFLEFAELKPLQPKNIQKYQVVEEMIKSDDNYQLHLSKEYKNFTPLKVGAPIYSSLGHTRLARDHETVVFPNIDVPIGQRTGFLCKLINY